MKLSLTRKILLSLCLLIILFLGKALFSLHGFTKSKEVKDLQENFERVRRELSGLPVKPLPRKDPEFYILLNAASIGHKMSEVELLATKEKPRPSEISPFPVSLTRKIIGRELGQLEKTYFSRNIPANTTLVLGDFSVKPPKAFPIDENRPFGAIQIRKYLDDESQQFEYSLYPLSESNVPKEAEEFLNPQSSVKFESQVIQQKYFLRFRENGLYTTQVVNYDVSEYLTHKSEAYIKFNNKFSIVELVLGDQILAILFKGSDNTYILSYPPSFIHANPSFVSVGRSLSELASTKKKSQNIVPSGELRERVKNKIQKVMTDFGATNVRLTESHKNFYLNLHADLRHCGLAKEAQRTVNKLCYVKNSRILTRKPKDKKCNFYLLITLGRYIPGDGFISRSKEDCTHYEVN